MPGSLCAELHGHALGTGDVLLSSGGYAGNRCHTFWLKSSVSMELPNNTVDLPGYNGAVLLGFRPALASL